MNLPRILRGLSNYRSTIFTISALVFPWTGCGQGADPASSLEAALPKISVDDISSKLEVISAPENAEKLKSLMAEPFKNPLAAVGRAGADINGTILKPSAAFLAKLNAAGVDKNKSYSSIGTSASTPTIP